MIEQNSIEALRARLDIVDVVGSYIELKKNGANFKAPCPFHDEKSPSFVVSPQKQIYHCFGCGAGGDSIKFVMEYEKLSYPEAIEKLAQSYNFTLSYTTGSQKKQDTKILEELNNYYKTLLTKNQVAYNYLQERGVYTSSIEKFQIGYAPSSDETLNFLTQRLFNLDEAQELGAVGRDEQRGRYYARFIERITFPIQANSGVVVGFGGRTITGHQAKYVNSPQTKLFNKSRLLYAYNLARESIYKYKEIIITEGYLDVVMLHQAGFTQAVATLGTALTGEHLPLLRKGDAKVIMAYDGDKAGRAAALKASRLLSVSGFDGGVVIFPEGADPADMVKMNRVEELNNFFRKPYPFINFVVDEIIANFDIHSPKQKEAALNEVVAYVKTLTPILQEEYRSYVASKLGISPSLVRLTKSVANNQEFRAAPVQTTQDTWELSLIKTMLERPTFIDTILNVVRAEYLQYHRYEFELALSSEGNHPALMAILLNDTIHSFESDDELKQELITFLIRHYTTALKQLGFRTDLSFDEKSFYIRKYRNSIAKLKRGELVVE